MKFSADKALNLVAQQFSPNVVLYLFEDGLFDASSKYECTNYESSLVEKKQLVAYGDSIICNYYRFNHSSIYIVSNIKKKKMLLVSRNVKGRWISVNLERVKETIIDLDDTGARWEGETLGNWPCGWGNYYNANNFLEYQGFCFRNWKVCYGTYFFPGQNPRRVMYQGMLCYDKYYGKGALYAVDGSLIEQCEWVNGVSTSNNTVVVPTGTLDKFFHNTLMKSFTIESECYSQVDCLVLSGYPYLKELSIHENSFSRTQNGLFMVYQCPELESIFIGSHSFKHFSECCIHDCPKLSSLVCDSNSFAYCHRFIVENLDSLSKLFIKEHSFTSLHELKWTHLNGLRIIQMQYQCILGDMTNMDIFGHYNNTFEMSHLPLLTRFFGDESCQYFGYVHIEDIPQLDDDFFAFTLPPFSDAHKVTRL